MTRTHILFYLFLFHLLPACGDDMMAYGPDAPQPPADAGPPDAEPLDAVPADAPPPPSDAEACRYLPESTETTMPNYPIRFKTGQGLEESPDLRQEGLLELENAHLGNREVIELRRGAVQLGDSRSTTPGDVVPDADRRAIWARGEEVLLETQDSIYRKQTAITSFVWSRAGAWLRMRLRELYANTFAADVLNADSAVLGDATLVAYQLLANTAQLAVYGPSMARENIQSFATSERPRLTSEVDRIRLTYRDTGTNTLFTGVYNPGGASITTANSTIAAPAARAWDVHSTQTPTGDRLTAFAVNAAAATNVNIRLAAQGTLISNYNRNLVGAVINDVTVNVWPRRVAKGGGGNSYRIAAAWPADIAGVQHIDARFLDFDVGTGALDAEVGVTVPLADPVNPSRSVAVGWVDRETVWVAVEQDVPGPPATRKVTYYVLTRPAGGVLSGAQVTHEATSLVGQGAIIAGTAADALVAAGAEPLSPGFVEMLLGSSMIQRSGFILYSPRTRAVVARSFVGFTGNLTTRSARPAKGSLIAEGQTITWAGAASVPSDPASETLRAIATCKLDRTARATKPAVIDGTAVDAHGGYPRAYDGTTAFEHDWHTLPRITGVATVAGAGINAGTYQFAATWEADDANGLRYRSGPDFLTNFSVAGPILSFNVTVEAMTHTERAGVKLVIWRTRANLPDYKRAGEFPITGATMTVNVAITDTTLGLRETLDQAPVPAGQAVVPSVPARVTDFVSLLLDRLASRDPRIGSLMTFTIPSREASGFATHWYSEGVLQEPLERDVTSAIEMNGRIVVGSTLGLAQLIQDGPDATGEGTFGLPLALLAPIGIEAHAATERLPQGYGFSTEDGPRLLTPGLTVAHIDEQVERHYSIDGGHVVAIAWDALRQEIVWLDETADTLRLNPHNGRWASDSNRTGRDLTVTKDGTVYILRSDGKVLQQSDDVFADGAQAYALRWTTPWIREPARDGQAHGGFNFAGVEVYGEYLGSHALTVTVYLDFRDDPVIFQGTISAGTIVANAAAGRDYRYVLYTDSRQCYGCKVVVETSAAPNATVRIAGVDVRYNPDGSANPAEVAEEQRFPLAISFLS